MGTLSSTVLDAVVSRLETWTPTRLPSLRFKHKQSPELSTTINPRTFTFDPNISTNTKQDYSSSVWSSVLTLIFWYPKNTVETFTQLKELASDQEEIFSRLAYLPASCWGTGFSVNAIPNIEIIDIENKYLTIQIDLELVYTRT